MGNGQVGKPPPGLSAAACRELNARADEAAVSVTGHFKDAFDATLAKHSEAVAWSIHAFHCQVANTKRFWKRSVGFEGLISRLWDLWRLNYFTSVRSRLDVRYQQQQQPECSRTFLGVPADWSGMEVTFKQLDQTTSDITGHGLSYTLLVGGLEHFLFSPIVGMMIQSDWYFSRLLKPPTSIKKIP